MQRSSTRCLLDRLEQLYVDMPTEGFFSSTPKYVQVPYKPPPPKVFIETTTQDQLEDIESTKQNITKLLKKINGMEKKAFEAQKEKMKICYDFFGKYEGALQSSEWARSFWFGLHYVPPPNQFDPRKKVKESKPPNIPKDWIQKMRFWRPDDTYVGMDPHGEDEVRKDLNAYNMRKTKWENYVDDHWNDAFDDAFGVSEFRAFLAAIPEKINVDLQTTPTKDVVTTWFDLFENTKYFHEKISMDHVVCEGYNYNEILRYLKDYDKRKQINEWKQKPKIVQRLYEKVQDLQDNVEILYKLTTVHWMPNIITYADGRSVNMFTRYDPIQRINIERKERPVYLKRTAVKPQKPTDIKKPQVAVSNKEKDNASNSKTKTTVKPQKPTDNKKPQVAVTNTGKDKAPTINNKKK